MPGQILGQIDAPYDWLLEPDDRWNIALIGRKREGMMKNDLFIDILHSLT